MKKTNESRLIKQFFELIQIDSPSGQEKNIAQFIFKKLRRIIPDLEIDKNNNVIGRWDRGHKDWLFLNAHLDTVEPGRNIKPIIKNNIIKSQGSTILGADNKAALAAIMETLFTIKKNNIPSLNLEIIFTASEESENLGAINLDYSKIKSKKGYVFDSADPIGCIVLAQPYYYNFNLEIIGEESHAGRPEEGQNILPAFAEALTKTKLGRLSEDTTVNIGTINCGQARNTIPGKIEAQGEIRSYFQEKAENNLTLIKKVFYQNTHKNNLKINFESRQENPGYLFADQDDFVLQTIKKIKALEFKPKLIKNMACSDVNIFNSKGLKILNLGNGISHPHTIKEEIKIKDLVKLNDLILKLILA